MLPRRIPKPPRFNAPKRVRSPGHLKFVRGFACVACSSTQAIHAHHVRLGAPAGIGQTPDDSFAVSLCATCHNRVHVLGEATFQKFHNLDLLALAAEFVKASPHRSKFNRPKEGQP